MIPGRGRRPYGAVSAAGILLVVLLLIGPTGGPSARAPSIAGSPALLRSPGAPHPGPGVRDPATAGAGVGRILVTNTDPSAAPNTGLRTELLGFKVDPFAGLSSLQVGAEEVLGGNLAVFGLFQNSPVGAYPFFSVFNNSTGLPVLQENESYDIVSTGTPQDFALEAVGGTNWTLFLNGEPFGGSSATGTVNFGVSQATDAGGIAFSMIALSQSTVVPPSLLVYTAVATRVAGTWRLPDGANSTWRGAASVEWGVQGADQQGALWPGELDLGTEEPIVANGTALWTGGPRAAFVTLASDPATAVGTGTTNVTVSCADAVGPLNGVPMELSDALGGAFLQPDPTTDASGRASTAYVAPNLTAGANDTLTAISNILGIGGVGTVVVPVSPVIRVALGVDGGTDVATGSTVSVLLTAREYVGGAPVPGIQLVVDLLGGGFVEPTYGPTDGNGELEVNVTAPRSIQSVFLTAVVATPGYWGRERLVFSATGPAPTLEQRLQAYTDWFVVAAVVLAALAVFWVTRLPKTRLPPLDLRRRRAPPPSRPGAPPSSSPEVGTVPPPNPPGPT